MSNSVYRFNYFVACQHFFPWVDLAMKLYLLHYRSGQFLLLKNISVFFFFVDNIFKASWYTAFNHWICFCYGFASVLVCVRLDLGMRVFFWMEAGCVA